MAKKKTAGTDDPTTTPATTRRRGARTVEISGTDPTTGSAAAINGGSTTTAPPIDAADDLSTAGASLTSESSYSPSYEEIAEAAYQRYLRRGGEHGRDFDDWLEAERDLRTRK